MVPTPECRQSCTREADRRPDRVAAVAVLQRPAAPHARIFLTCPLTWPGLHAVASSKPRVSCIFPVYTACTAYCERTDEGSAQMPLEDTRCAIASPTMHAAPFPSGGAGPGDLLATTPAARPANATRALDRAHRWRCSTGSAPTPGARATHFRRPGQVPPEMGTAYRIS